MTPNETYRGLLQGGLDNLLKGAATQCLQVRGPNFPVNERRTNPHLESQSRVRVRGVLRHSFAKIKFVHLQLYMYICG